MGLKKVDIPNVGRQTYCASAPVVWNVSQTTIGSFVSIGSGVTIGNGQHPTDFLSTSPYFYLDHLGFKNDDMVSHNEYMYKAPVHIGNDVWIGENVKISNGVTIGDGAIVGRCAVVTKDVPPYAIVVGVPAKILRYRFDEETIAKLLKLKWWELDDEVIKTIPYDNISTAISYIEKIRNLK